ncbi:hypothetical protein MKW98_001224, partial [Papaver atlanticum]
MWNSAFVVFLHSMSQARIRRVPIMLCSLRSITENSNGPKHIETTLTRAKFEELKVPVENCLRDAWLTFTDLDEVILIGGSTHPNATVNPDEEVALGAAVQ